MSNPLPVRALNNLCALNLLRHRELELRLKLTAEQSLVNEARRIVYANSTGEWCFDLDAPFGFGVAL